MPRPNNKKNLIHGSITILIGVAILIWGPIDFRGAPVNRWIGTLVCMFGFAVVLLELLKKRSKNKSKRKSGPIGP